MSVYFRRKGKEDSGPGFERKKDESRSGPCVMNEAFLHDPVAMEQNAEDGNPVVGDDDLLNKNDEVAVEEQDNKPRDSVPPDDTYGNQESKFTEAKYKRILVKFIREIFSTIASTLYNRRSLLLLKFCFILSKTKNNDENTLFVSIPVRIR